MNGRQAKALRKLAIQLERTEQGPVKAGDGSRRHPVGTRRWLYKKLKKNRGLWE